MDRIKLLIVDDLEENLLALEAVLGRHDIDLVRARSGSQALEWLLQHEFALAIIDVHMPDMTGFELAEMMRGTERTRRIPIIFMTASVPDQHRQFRGYESGAVDFLYKPFDSHILVSKVNVFIELARQRSEIIRQRDDLQKAKMSAESANAAKDRFLAVLSHELRNPLAPIRMLTTLWEMEGKLPEEYRDGLDMIRRNIDLECRLIDDMLDISRITRGKLELRRETVDANDLVRNVVQIIQPDCDRKGISFKIHLEADSTTLYADAARIQQVLWNLLNNAVKFTPEGGVIELAVSNPQADVLRLSVSDSGIGIEPEKVSLIFDAFEQGGQTITREFGGLGLGLAISQAIAQRHGGKLTATSNGCDQGACFSLELETRAAGRSNRRGDKTNLSTVSGCTKSLHILLVEDQRTLARLTEQLLKKIGHTVTVAGSIAEALKSCQESQFDLIISDFGLPDGDGCELLSYITHGAETPAIALTGYGMEEDIRRAIASGYKLHLTKPVTFKQLVSAIVQSV
jgi:signal transduction histidine kinase